ncbi:MAG: biotin-dependent carboxyltransferase family protein [Planctomycetota bacterium]
MAVVRVIEAGMFTAIQDVGRIGYNSLGVPRSGAADALSLIVGNRLLGNDDNAAALECTLLGPTLAFDRDCCVSVTGAACAEARVETDAHAQSIEWCSPTPIKAGDVLTLGRLDGSARAYLCIAGGIDIEPMLGSRATCPHANLGGLQGRPLRKNDALPIAEPRSSLRSLSSGLQAWLRDELRPPVLRIVPSLHTDDFSAEAIQQLCESAFTVREQSSRIGTRLLGDAIAPPPRVQELDSEPTVEGAIQITGDGQAIILGPDRPTTGGYPIAACVIAADLPALAMLRPRDTVHFEWVSLDQARTIAVTQRAELDALLPMTEAPS